MIDCFWCGTEYDAATEERCPQCSTDIDTKSIPKIRDGETADELRARLKNGTTSE